MVTEAGASVKSCGYLLAPVTVVTSVPINSSIESGEACFLQFSSADAGSGIRAVRDCIKK
jgi:hypothetical protein